MKNFEKNNERTVNGWAMFDWANSAYALVITTAVFPAYFINFTPEQIEFWGLSMSNSTLFSYAVSFSYIIIAFLSPLLSGIADYSGRRKIFLKFFTTMGSLACMLLFFFKSADDLVLATSAFIIATIGFAGGLVFYNAYLPIIVTEDRYDKVSAKGFAYGYTGSVILLVIILAMIQKPTWFFISDPQLPVRIGFLMVGIWWIGFAQITFARLPDDQQSKFSISTMGKGFDEIKMVFSRLKNQPWLRRFLLSFFFYSAGAQTIINLASVFATKELQFGRMELIILILILQLFAIGGAYFFAYLSSKTSNKASISAMLIIWIVICLGAYFAQGKTIFYVLASLVGLVMGGIQSLSRSTYSKMLENKETDTTSYFSFYDVLYKGSIVMGAFLFGFVENITGSIRLSMIMLSVLFVIGFFLLRSIKSTEIS